jgi:superfamily II DNA/RNA helicase
MSAHRLKSFPNVLKNARELASMTDNYSSQLTRQAIAKRCEEAFNGNKPYDWQIDVTEALLLGLDCVAIAGTGAGKTMPFGLPLLMDESRNKMVIVISPLNDLEAEQVSTRSRSKPLDKY